MSIDYAWEKFYKACLDIASSESSLQKRLADAHAYHIIHVAPADVSPALWQRIDKLGKTLTVIDAVGNNEGRIQATTENMSTEQARILLEEIVSIFNDVAEEYYKRTK